MSEALKRLSQTPTAMLQFVKGRLAKVHVEDPSDVPAGQGDIVDVGSRRLAIYKDGQGNIHAMSPVCPHMRCIVHWNREEGTWDCPCHGSRFDPYGHVKQGPAKKKLAHEPLDD